MTAIDRRSFLIRGAAFAGAGLAGSTALARLDAAAAHAAGQGDGRGKGSAANQGRGNKGGYGPLTRMRASNDPNGPEWLALPEGFSYVAFGRIGDPMSDGVPTPYNLDGMGAFGLHGGRVRLIRNTENRKAPGDASQGAQASGPKYDAKAYGGTTTLDFDTKSMRLVRDFVSSTGTIVNCAGGVMLGDVGWVTSEETTAGPTRGWDQKHGYNFIVPVSAVGPTFPQPLREMGRFSHEAVAVDPRTGFVYETEDSGDNSGFYRFLPDDTHDLTAGGRLQMLAVAGVAGFRAQSGQQVGQRLPVAWVDIPDPDPDLEGGASSVSRQAVAAGAAMFNRLEGIWWGGDRLLFNSTSGGTARMGQVWEYRPERGGDGTLTLVYESTGVSPVTGRAPLDSPDNLTITPRGGVLLCEDDASGSDGDTHPLAPGITNVNRLIGLGDDGLPFEFAVNTLNDAEFAGACFAPNAKDVLFVNNFGTGATGSGATFAITGPWQRGAL